MLKIFLYSLLGIAPLACAAKTPEDIPLPESGARKINADTSFKEILTSPVLSDFAGELLPWEGAGVRPDMKLSDLAELLPYHSEINPSENASALNRLISDARKGKRVFYDFYTEEQKKEDPDKENTGLFFFRGRPGAPFAVVCPGGGFAYVAVLHGGLPVAEQISDLGFNAFVLKYRAGSGQHAVEDLASALNYIENHAGELEVAAENYSLWGGSAGARMAAAIGSYGTAPFGADKIAKPAAVIMAYTGQSGFTADDPPTFIAAAENDFIAPAEVMARRADGLMRAGVPVEFHVYPGLRHGFGTGSGTSARCWIKQAAGFWKRFVKQD